jgi:peptidoglycan-associated lipoprotein
MNFKKLAVISCVVLAAACSKKNSHDMSGHDMASHVLAGSEQDFKVNVGDRVHFDTDRHDLNQEGRSIIERQAAWLKQYDKVHVQVEGHADERYTRAYNIALGARRAQAAKDYLVSLGIEGARIHTISYGKDRPEDPRSESEAWAKNRRAVTLITSGAKK